MGMWIAYGSITGAHAVLWANLITGVQAAVILSVKFTSSREVHAQADAEADTRP
jgi:hypothetical protein